MTLDYPRMLYRRDGSTRVVPSVEVRDEALAEGWLELIDFQRGNAPEPVSEPEPEKPSKRGKKVH